MRVLDETKTTQKRLQQLSGDVQTVSNLPKCLDQRTFEATCAFFTEYSNTTPGLVKTEYDMIKRLHSAVNTDSILLDMIAVVGLATMACKQRDASRQHAADKCYHKVLQRTSRALGNVNDAVSDEMLVTVWLLNLHEVSYGVIQNYCRGNQGWRLTTPDFGRKYGGEDYFTLDSSAGRSQVTPLAW